MEAATKPQQAQLDISNERLQKAFGRLDAAIATRISTLEGAGQHEALAQENARLQRDITLLSEEYAALKQASMEAFTHLNHSINQLESLITHNDSNSSR